MLSTQKDLTLSFIVIFREVGQIGHGGGYGSGGAGSLSFENAKCRQLADYFDCRLQSRHYLGAALNTAPTTHLDDKDGAMRQTTHSDPISNQQMDLRV
jgi:hypothetical protein